MTPNVYSRVLRKSFTNRFFEENALFFFFVIGAAGGVMSGNEHVALATFFVSYPILTLIPALLWALYGIKVIVFNRRVRAEPVMAFINTLTLAPVQVKVLLLFMVVLTQSLPVVFYGAFLLLMAFRMHVESSLFIVVAELLILLLLLTLDFYVTLHRAGKEKKTNWMKRLLDRTMIRSFPQMFLEWVLRQQPGMVLAAKVINCLILYGICKLYEYDSYDIRFLAMGSTLTWATSMTIIYQFVNFESQTLSLTRNLPIPITRRMLMFLGSVVLTYIPEYLFLARNFPAALTLMDLLQLLILGLSIQSLSYCLLLRTHMAFDRFSQFVFAATLGTVVIILFGFPLYLLTVIAFAFSAYGYSKYYYRYERYEPSSPGGLRSSANHFATQDRRINQR